MARNNHPFVLVFFIVHVLRLWKTHFLEQDIQVIGYELDVIVMTCPDHSGRTLNPLPCLKQRLVDKILSLLIDQLPT